MLFTSRDLPAAWPRLDAFAGPGYRRTTTTVELDDDATVEANIYEIRPGTA